MIIELKKVMFMVLFVIRMFIILERLRYCGEEVGKERWEKIRGGLL